MTEESKQKELLELLKEANKKIEAKLKGSGAPLAEAS